MLDDPTGIEDCVKQEALDFIRFNIEQVLKHGREDRVVQEKVRHIDLKDIDNYLLELKRNQSLDVKDLRIRSVAVRDLEKFSELCDYVSAYDVKYPSRYEHKIYFIESGDFAITFIPTELESQEIDIYIEPLESSPDLISEMYANLEKGKSIKDIYFVSAQDLNK